MSNPFSAGREGGPGHHDASFSCHVQQGAAGEQEVMSDGPTNLLLRQKDVVLERTDSLVGGFGVGPSVQAVHVVVPHFLPIAEYLLTVHAQRLVV